MIIKRGGAPEQNPGRHQKEAINNLTSRNFKKFVLKGYPYESEIVTHPLFFS